MPTRLCWSLAAKAERSIPELWRHAVVCTPSYPTQELVDNLNNTAAIEPTQINLFFIANNASHKFEELKYDPNVNVSFYDHKTTGWASVSGTAKVTQDKDLIKKFWSPMFVPPVTLSCFSSTIWVGSRLSSVISKTENTTAPKMILEYA